MRSTVLRKTWRPIAASRRVEEVLSSWKGTPYMALQSCKGKQGGIDCVRFVCASADELYGYSRGPLESLPPDQSLHDREGCIAAMRLLCRRYEPLDDATEDEYVEPGDILVVGPKGGGPGHAMFVGGSRGHIWECVQHYGVVLSGMPMLGDTELFRILRVKDKNSWL